MATRRKGPAQPREDGTTIIQGRVHAVHREFVEEAAATLGITLSHYVGSSMVKQAARDLRKKAPEVPAPAVKRGHTGSYGAELDAMRADLKREILAEIGGFEKTASPATVKRRRIRDR